MEVETLKSFPLTSEQPAIAPPRANPGSSSGSQVDLYSRLKSLERQLEFLEIRVRLTPCQVRLVRFVPFVEGDQASVPSWDAAPPGFPLRHALLAAHFRPRPVSLKSSARRKTT